MENKITLSINGYNRDREELEVIVYEGRLSLCNGWGYEISVNSKGIITEVASLCKQVDSNGFIVSLHGDYYKDLISSNVSIGDTCFINKETSSIVIIKSSTDETYYTLIVDELKACQNYVLKNLLDYDKSADEIIDQIIRKVNLKDYDELKALKLDALCALSPSRMIENRGVWHRPREKDLQEVLDTISILKEANMTSVYLESDVDNSYCFKYEDYPVYKVIDNTYDGFKDYFDCFISLCHKEGIEVVLWDKVMNVCKCMYDKYDEYKLRYYDDKKYTPFLKNNLSFFDPSIEEVQDLIIKRIDYLLTNYSFDGYQADYIRYPEGNMNLSTSSGYSTHAINEFTTIYHTTIEDNYELFSEYRRNKITTLVRRINSLLKSNHKDVFFSISVFSDIDNAYNDKLQDYPLWIKEGLIDNVEIMAYYFDQSAITKDSLLVNKLVDNKAYNYVGIAPTYNNLPILENIYQVLGARNGNSEGYMIFCLNNLTPDVVNVLKKSVNRYKSIKPHDDLDKVLTKAVFELDTLFTKYYDAVITDNSLKLVLLNTLKDLIKDSVNTLDKINELKSLDFKNNIVNNRIKEYLDYLIRIVKIKENKKQV